MTIIELDASHLLGSVMDYYIERDYVRLDLQIRMAIDKNRVITVFNVGLNYNHIKIFHEHIQPLWSDEYNCIIFKLPLITIKCKQDLTDIIFNLLNKNNTMEITKDA